MNYYAQYQQQEYDPSSQTQQLYDQSENCTNNYYSYYSNPQYPNLHPYPYPYYNHTVQPTQREEQEPNPPGVTPTQQPEQGQNTYYQLTVDQQQGAVDPGVAVVHQTILQPPNQPYHVYGHGRDILPSHIHGGSLSQSYAMSHHTPGQNFSARPYHGRGRARGCGRGRGRGRALNKHAAPPAKDKKRIIPGGSDIHGRPPQSVPQSIAQGFGQIPMPFQGPAQPMPVLPPSKAVCCELCRVECNTVEILEQHMNGKKHKKKLKVFEELKNLNKRMISGHVEQIEVPSQSNQIEGSGNKPPQQEISPSQETNEESQVAVEKQKVDVGTAEELVKRVKMDRSGGVVRGLKRKMRGGKGSRKMRLGDRSKNSVEPPKPKEVFIPLVCELCNVKCESLIVFQSHLVGKNHQSKAKRFIGHQETLGQEPIQLQRPSMQTYDQQNANASTSIVSQVQDQGFGGYQGVSAQNMNITYVQASTLEAVSHIESLGTKSEVTLKEGHSETEVQSDNIVRGS